jgi:hypothetical protein
MIVLRDPQATNQITDPYIRELVALRWSQVLAGEPYDYNRHGYMVVVEPGDTVEQLEQEIGLPILHGLFDDVPFGHDDFTPCFDTFEEHTYENGNSNEQHRIYEMVFIRNDDGFATTVIVPDAEGIPGNLLAMCRSFATPAVVSFLCLNHSRQITSKELAERSDFAALCAFRCSPGSTPAASSLRTSSRFSLASFRPTSGYTPSDSIFALPSKR